MDLGWPFARTRRESKAAIPLVALSQLGSPAWGGRDAASQLAGNAFVEAVQIDGRDGIAALSVKRDAPWECLETASFATVEEKHAIAGLGT